VAALGQVYLFENYTVTPSGHVEPLMPSAAPHRSQAVVKRGAAPMGMASQHSLVVRRWALDEIREMHKRRYRLQRLGLSTPQRP
jgi:hypothetical protein